MNAVAVRDKVQLFDALYRNCARRNRAGFLAPALERAANVGNADLLKTALEIGASANTLVSGGAKPVLHEAAAGGNEKAVQALLCHGALVNEPDKYGITALHAVANNPKDCVGAATALLAAGANAKSRSRGPHGRTPLELALEYKCMGVIMALVRYGADVKDTTLVGGDTALHTAVRCKHDGAISVLVKAGADVNATGYRQYTPLHYAVDADSPRSVKALCEYRANKNKRNASGDTPLHHALTAPWKPRVAVALVEAGANVHLRQLDKDKFSALDLAAMGGHVSMLRRLIRHGAKVNAADPKGVTALHHAAFRNQTAAIHVLVQAGANANAQDSEEQTPLHYASKRQAFRAVNVLLHHGATTVNARDKLEQVPLHLATRASRGDSSAQTVERLLRYEADERMIDHAGRTAADVVGLDALHGGPGGGLPGNPAVLDLLANAPAERIERRWRRRSFLVMCRSRPNRAPPMPPERADEASRRADGTTTHKRARLAGVESGGGDAGNAHRGFAERASTPDLVATVVNMREDGLFRKVMSFL